MKSIIFTISILVILVNISYSQYSHEWARWYNYSGESLDIAYSSTVDSAGNSYITGISFDPNSDYDICTIKYNSSGVRLWASRYNGPGNSEDIPSDITVDKSGNVYVTGKTLNGTSYFDIVTIKYNSNGIQQWADLYNGGGDSTDMGISIAVDLSGNTFICGGTRKAGNFNPDCITIKLSGAGTRLWVRTYEYQTNSEDSGMVVRTDINGNCYVSVKHNYSLVGLIKYNASGSLSWSRSVETSPYQNFFYDMEIDRTGNCYVNLRIDSASGNPLKLYRYTSNGILSWVRNIYETNDYIRYNEVNNFKTLDLDSTGNPYVISSPYSIYRSFAVTKYDQNGTILWTSVYNLPPPQSNPYLPISINADNSGNLFVLSYSQYFSTGYDFYIVKFNSSGIKQWYARYYDTFFPGSNDIPCGIATDYSGNAFAMGYGVQLGSEYDYLSVKYPSSLQLNAKVIIEGMYDSANNLLNKRDTVRAFLRSSVSPYPRIDSAIAVVDSSDFKTGFCFNNADQGNYYIELRHRNSIEVWSKTGGEFFSKSSPVYYDFTATNSQVYGQNMRLNNGKYCIFSGDVNQSGIIDGTDLSLIDNSAFVFASGYVSTDLTGDGFVDATDFSIADNNALSFVGVERP